jgi:hypothetical protein
LERRFTLEGFARKGILLALVTLSREGSFEGQALLSQQSQNSTLRRPLCLLSHLLRNLPKIEVSEHSTSTTTTISE